MLEYVKIVNINSIGECEIDFRKDKYKYLENNIIGDCVNPIALYGHNGSGKTSFIKAIAYLVSLLTWPVDNLVPFIVNDFSFKKAISSKKESLATGSIELRFALQETRYEYFIAVSAFKRITKEYLKKEKEYIFERTIEEEKYGKATKKIEGLRSLLIPSIRYFASEMISDNDIQKVYSFLSNFTVVDLPHMEAGEFVTSKQFLNMTKTDLIVKKTEEVKNILRNYKGFPIYDVIKVEKKNNINGPYYIKYEGFDGMIPLGMMSEGMFNQSILLSILVSIPENSVLFIDEIDHALHPSALSSFVSVAKEKKIQLVFSSHNTYLLQSLRPDQVYFANWEKGKSTFKRLSKIYPNIREINNIEKMYLSSVFDEAIKNGE